MTCTSVRRTLTLVLLSALMLPAGITTRAALATTPGPPLDAEKAPQSLERLVVFEGFLRSGCGNCRVAAPQMDRLAQEYASRPVVFLEYDVDNPVSSRYNRWWAASGYPTSATLPLTMVDSGYRYRSGFEDFYTAYKGMVDAALANPPQAELIAYMQRSGDAMAFSVVVTNRSGQPLSQEQNAAVHALVYQEGGNAGLTQRFVHVGGNVFLDTPLPDGEPRRYAVTTADLETVDWQKLRGIALLDYRPDEQVPSYYALQAASATLLEIAPSAITFMVEPGDTTVAPALVHLNAPQHLTWTLSFDADWLTITQSSGSMTENPGVSVDPAHLASGWQATSVTLQLFDVGTVVWVHPVTVKAYLGVVSRVHLPMMLRR
ncbi:MAG: hypothetical protein MUQ30_14570 [Anaerolineae bacterium]|nr:hypothetical protein [Anaerolineae bacterium]